MRGLSHKRALVTGGTSGLGAAIARRLVEEGARVVICGRDGERGHALAAEIGASFVQADVRSETDNERSVAEAIEQLGGLDIAVLNPGRSRRPRSRRRPTRPGMRFSRRT